MSEYWLVVVDTTQIQAYIFGSNRLAENIGASWLVKQATGAWALEAVKGVAPHHNIRDAQTGQLDDAVRIENDGVDAEAIYAAGGNVLALFAAESMARGFIRTLSRKVLLEAPGLQLLFALEHFDWDAKPAQLFDTVQKAFQSLEVQKNTRPRDASLLGLGVTMACQSTGLPANAIHKYDGEEARPASAEILAKMSSADASHKNLRSTFQDAIGSEYDFPREFDELGRSAGEQSYIAVVHADGDGLGQRMIKIGRANKEDNRTYIDAVRGFSQAVARASEKAMKDTLDTLTRPAVIISDEDDRHKERRSIVRHVQSERINVAARITLKCGGNRWYLPFRPLVYGGDDTTFVCDGRIGVALAVEYLTQFRHHAEIELSHTTSASAGVAIVKSHYPFARAYDLAEELCKNAKRYRAQEKERTKAAQGSYLDWHFATSGLSGDIKEIREREYNTKHGRLCLRPLKLDVDAPEFIDRHTVRCWAVLQKALEEFQGEKWADRRNKVKALRDALRQGSDAVTRFCTMYDIDRLPELALGDPAEYRKTGWIDGVGKEPARCVYFDAIELADFHIPLFQPEPEKEEA